MDFPIASHRVIVRIDASDGRIDSISAYLTIYFMYKVLDASRAHVMKCCYCHSVATASERGELLENAIEETPCHAINPTFIINPRTAHSPAPPPAQNMSSGRNP